MGDQRARTRGRKRRGLLLFACSRWRQKSANRQAAAAVTLCGRGYRLARVVLAALRLVLVCDNHVVRVYLLFEGGTKPRSAALGLRSGQARESTAVLYRSTYMWCTRIACCLRSAFCAAGSTLAVLEIPQAASAAVDLRTYLTAETFTSDTGLNQSLQ